MMLIRVNLAVIQTLSHFSKLGNFVFQQADWLYGTLGKIIQTLQEDLIPILWTRSLATEEY